MVVYYHEGMCLVEKLVHYLQCQGHNKGLYNQNTTVSVVSSVLLVSLQLNIISWSVMWKNGITVIKVTANVQNVCPTIFSEPQYIWLPNLVWICSIISWSVMQKKNWFSEFNVKVTMRA